MSSGGVGVGGGGEMNGSACPSDEQLDEVIGGNPDAARGWVVAHLENCPACQRRLDQLVSQDSVPPWARAALGRTGEQPGGRPDPAFLASLRVLVPRLASCPVNPPDDTHAVSLDPEPCPSRLGSYDILGEIGRGGMAVVYKARQPLLDRIVALKRLRPRDQDGADVARFLREAESIARVPHPHIVQVFEVGEDDGRPFLVLEFVGGGSLAEFLGGGAPVEPRAAAAFLEKVARAVQHAHRHGVIHRDLKPTNILLASVGDRPHPADRRPTLDSYEPKVADFGLARRIGDDRGLTQPDMFAGTPAYLAPEQLTGKPGALSPACDIYALGVILYEMLTGRPPLVGPTALVTLRLVETVEPVAPRRLQPQLPRDLEAICLKCLAKDPRRRYATAEELATDLGRFLAGKPTAARPLNAVARGVKLVGQHPRAAGVVGLFVLAVACGVAGILWQWRAAEHARANLQVALDAEAEHRRDAEENLYYGRLAQAAALWESGEAAQARSLLAACQPAEGRTNLRGWEWNYLSRQFRPELHVFRFEHWINGLVPVPATTGAPPEMALAVGRPRMNAADRILPGDGRAGYLRPLEPTSALRPGPVLPGAATTVAVHPSAKFVAWGTNAGDIVLGRGTTDVVAQTIATPAPVSRLRFSPDGTVLLATGEDAHLRAFDPETGALLHDGLARVGRPWALDVHPAGTLVAVGGGTGVVRLFDPRGWRAVGDLNGQPGVTSLGFSADGTALAAGCSEGSVVVWDPATRRELRRIQSPGGPVYAVAMRSDGKALAIGGADRTVRVYDWSTERLQATYRGHESSVRSLAFGAGDERLMSGGQDGSVRVWDATRDVRGRLIPFDHSLNDAAFRPSPEGLQVAAASTYSLAKTWSVADGRVVGQIAPPITRRPPYPRRYSVFLNGGRRLVGIDKDNPNALVVCDAVTGQRQLRLSAGRGPVQVLGSDHTRQLIVWATPADDDVDIHWRDPDAESQPPPVRLDARGLAALTIDLPSGQLAAVTAAARTGGDQSLWVFDLVGARPPREVARGSGMSGGLSFNLDGSRLAVSMSDAVEVYRTSTWERVHRLLLAPSTTCLAFSPDGRRLAAVGYDGHATLFDPIAGKRVFELRSLAPGRPDDMAAEARVAFSPDGAWLLSTNWDGSLNLWDGRPTRD
jgi:WD40 repeat protein/tRNA A-37 threonylcarbamoyl transferase component Bud32